MRAGLLYAIRIGFRYLRARKHAFVSVSTVIAVTGVALGVAALAAVMSITSGFQEEFQRKVLGVNAHVLVMKFGLDFGEYRDVVVRARRQPGVVGAAPFVINEMMLSKGDRLSGVLVKGVDPDALAAVLDLPSHVIRGSLVGLRRPGAAPPIRPDDLERPTETGADSELDRYLAELAARDDAGPGDAPDAGAAEAPPPDGEPTTVAAPGALPSLEEAERASEGDLAALPDEDVLDDDVPSPDDAERTVAAASSLPSLEEAEQANEGELPSLPDEDVLDDLTPSDEDRTAVGALPGIIVGATLAQNLGIHVGDEVTVISPLTGLDVSLWRPNAATPRSRRFRVISVFQAGFDEYDSHLVYVDLYEAQAFHDQGDVVTGVEIKLRDMSSARETAHRLERELGGAPFHTMDWEELNHNLFTALRLQKVALSIVFSTIIVVASFCVIAVLIMVVLEKKREIAILKAMGATDGGVLSIFVTFGACIGTVGTVLGLGVGFAVCRYLVDFGFPLDPKVYLIDHLPVRLAAADFVVTGIVALVICVSATVIPSLWAARLLPVDGLRYD